MPRLLAHQILLRVFRDDRARVRELLGSLERARRLDRRDLDLAREIAAGVLRHEGALSAVLDTRTRKPLDEADAKVRTALLIGAYQVILLDRVPGHAAVDSAVEVVKRTGRDRAAGFVNAVLRRTSELVDGEPRPEPGAPRRSLPRGDGTFALFTEDVLPDPATDPAGHLAARWSHPQWLVERLLEQHGAEATAGVLAAGVARPTLSLRPARGREDELRAALAEAGIAFEDEGRCLLLRGGGRVEALPGYDEGWFVVQGATSAEVVPLLAPAAGDAVLELCAAPGGKTVAIREAVGDGGLVMAVDASEPRLARLRAEMVRRGFDNVAALAADATDSAALPKGVADRAAPGFDAVLVDVPCSNTGVLSRRPEVRRRLGGLHRVEALAQQAERLLAVAASRVRSGGRLVYSTCSIDRRENEDVVRAALAAEPRLTLAEERFALPVAGRRDGGYAALLNLG